MNKEYNYAEATPITSAEYVKLDNPQFVAQSRVDENGEYHMYWECDGVLYKTTQNLFNI